jgi:tRNA-binding protein
MENLIDWSDFQKVELRVGTIVAAARNPRSSKPAYVLTIDLGPRGTKVSSAQITDYYDTAALTGRQVLCVCNFAPKNVAGITSEVLVTGAYDDSNKVVLAGFDRPLPNGSRLS